jgi:RHS repeat-associated protein
MLGTVLYEFEYDAFGRVVGITDGDGNRTVVERDGRGTGRAIVGPSGHRTELAVRDGYLEELTDPAGSTYAMTYEAGLMKTFTDPEGALTSFSYDEDGYLAEEADPSGGSTMFSRWQDSGRCIVTRTSGLGEVWTYDVNRLESGIIETCTTEPGGGNMNAVLDPAGLTTITYPDGSAVSQQTKPDPRFGMGVPILDTETLTTPLGVAVTTSLTRSTVLADPLDVLSLLTQDDTLNVNGSLVYTNFSAEDSEYSVTTPAGRRVTYLYDEQGRLVEESFPSSGVTPIQYEYDDRGRLARLIQGSQQWSFGLDDRGRLATFDDAAGRRVTYEYDNADRQTRLVLPSGRAYGFAYNWNGDLVQLTMPNGMLHHFARTPAGSFYTYHMPDGRMYTTLYNIDQQRESVTLPMDDTESFTYDASGNIQTISYPEATVQFTYSGTSSSCCICGDGQMTITRTPVSGAAQALELAYDGHLLIGTNFSGAANARYTLAYDGDNDPVSITLEGADATAVAFNDDGELTTYGPFTFRRNGPVGSVDRISDSALALNYTYDTYGRVASRNHIVNGVNVYALSLNYDLADNLLSKTETKAGLAETIRYTYNADGELLTVSRNSAPAEEYDYDLNRNRSSASRNGGETQTATYDSLDRLTSRGAVTYQFDDNGCLVSRGADTFTYSTRGELLQAQLAGGTTIAYTYDGFGRLVARTDGTGTRQYLYDGLGSVFLVTEFRDAAGELTRFYYDDYGLLYAMRQGAAWFYVACDQMGTPQVVADAAGAVVKQITWDSYGNLLSDSNPAMFMPIGFVGGIVDPDVGLIRFGLRDYEPASGRWATRDPALFQGGSNLYAYAFNDPVNRRDPTGLFCVSYGGYARLGMEFGLCVTGDGMSICGEAGFGLGGGIGIDPFGGLAAEELFLNAEVTGSVGVASGGYAGHWGTCGSSHGPRCQLGAVNFCERKANLDSGNFNRTASEALRRDYRHTRGSVRQIGQHTRDRNLRGLFGSRRGAIRAQGKLTGGACGQVLW